MWLAQGLVALIVLITLLTIVNGIQGHDHAVYQRQEEERITAGIRQWKRPEPDPDPWDRERVRTALGRHTSEEVAVRTGYYRALHAAPVALDLETFQEQEARRRALFMPTSMWTPVTRDRLQAQTTPNR